MATIGSLLIKILGDADGLRNELARASQSTASFEKSLKKFEQVGVSAIVAVGVAMVTMTVIAGQQAEALQHLSAVTGISTDTLQEYDVLMAQSGLSGEDLTLVMRTLSKSMEEAQLGTGTAGDRFRQLGIDIKTVTGTDDLIRKIAESVSQFANGTEKAAVVSDLMGRGALRWIPAMEGGAAAIDGARMSSKGLGDELTTLQLKTLGTMDDSIDRLGIAWKRFGLQMGAALAPEIEKAVVQITQALAGAANMMKELSKWIDIDTIQFEHLGLAASEVFGTLFSKNAFSADAWVQVYNNLKLINSEANKLVAKREALKDVAAPKDTRPKLPAMIDSAKAAASAGSIMEAELRATEQLFSQKESLMKANLSQYLATLDQAKAAGTKTDWEVEVNKENALAQGDRFTIASIEIQLENYRKFHAQRSAAFTADSKGVQDRAKFEVEANAKEVQLVNQLAVAKIAADTQAIQSATAVGASYRKDRLIPIQDEITVLKANFELQKTIAATAPQLGEATLTVRESAMNLLMAETQLRREEISNTIADERRKNNALIALDLETDAKRRGIIQQFPGFWQKQMQDLVSSNTFSVSQIVSTWTGGLANAIVNGGEFMKAAWNQTQVAIVQAALNTGVQLAAQWALNAAVEMGLVASSAAGIGAINAAKNSLIIAGEAGTAAGTVGIWAGATAAMAGMMMTLKIQLALLYTSIIEGLTVVGTAIMGVLTAIGEAIGFTGFGAPLAGAILAGVVAIGIALAAMGAIKFAKGGLVTGPTMGMLGEAGPEMVIPLDRLGDFGGNKETIISVPVILDGRQIAFATARHQPAAWRNQGAPA